MIVSSDFAARLRAFFIAATIAMARSVMIESGERPIHIV
jgi:hypothetical protein